MLEMRLRGALYDAGYTPSAFARRVGESRQTVDGWLQRGVPPRKCFRVGRILDVNPEWLVVSSCREIGLKAPSVEAFLLDFSMDEATALRKIIGSFRRHH